MLKTYFKIAWRNLGKHKGDTAINLLGLCVAFTAALLLFLSVFFEFSYDNFHKNKNQIYHVFINVSGTNATKSTALPIPMMPSLKEEYPDVQYFSRYISGNGNIRYNNKQLTQNLRYTDPDFFKMFSFGFVQGDARTALNDMNNIVLSEKAAKRIFGDDDALGKTFQLKVGGQWRPFTVSAIAVNPPENSSITFDMITRFENVEIYNDNQTEWDNWNHSAYIQLKPGVTAEQFARKTNPFFNVHFAGDIAALKRDGAKPAADGSYMSLGLLSLKNLHTETDVAVEGGSISKNYLYLLLAIAILILLIASINFINLSIGRSFTRSHEIGLRKTLGALRWQLVAQLWVEALLICFFALAVSALLTYALLPSYKQLFHMSVRRELLLEPLTWLWVLASFLIVSLIAGGYPAWLIARVNVISILKGKFSIRRSQRIRNSLIVVQFAIAVLLMICTFITWQQVNFLRNQPLGYNRSQVISVPIEGDQDPNTVLERLREKLNGYPNIQSVSGIYNNLGRGLDGSNRNSSIGFDYKNKNMRTGWMGVSFDFTKTLDLKLVAGRDFSREFPTDSNAIVINEAMAKQLGEKEIIGLQLPIHDSASYMTVIGVVKDFNYESLHKEIKPISFTIERPFGVHYALVKVTPANLPGSMSLIKEVWKKILPNSEFKGSFLDENIDRQYKKEEKLGQIFISGAIIAIVLSCMGLLAMVLLIVTQRVKEIGIRKVLGASISNIVVLISKDFMWLVIIAFVIAAPLGWWSMQKWLEHFAYRIDIQWWVFVLAAVLAFAIAFITISLQAVRAALSNPVKNLRTE
jgi:ABC-type antimicrobial peptide transport system permease subunit